MQNNTGTKQKNTEWLGKAANTMGVLIGDQYSAIWLRKSMAYKECEIVFDNSQVWAWSVESAVCVVSAMDDEMQSDGEWQQ